MEGRTKTEPKATHEVKVIRADGSEEVVAQRVLSPEESKLLLQKMQAEAPEMVAEARQAAVDKKRAKLEVDERG